MPLEARDVSGGYGHKLIVEAVHLALDQGEWLSLLGANGSGKSTLLRLLSRVLKPERGVVLLDGKAIQQQPTQAVARKLALLPQQQRLPAGLTVKQLVSLGRSPYQSWYQWDLDEQGQHQVQAALAQTGLEDFQDRPVEQLSGGERQRVFLALALAQEPKVLLLDEPTTFLDIHYQLQLLELLKGLNQTQGLAIITVLHDVNLAARYSHRLAFLNQGYLHAIGPTAEVLTPQNLAQVFDVDVAILDTPIGPQICPLAACQNRPDLPIPIS